MTFKDILEKDISGVFFNNDEFSEEVVINGRKMNVIFDNDEYTLPNTKAGKYFNGLYKADKVIYVKASEYGARPRSDSLLTVERNGKAERYRVTDADEENGVLVIGLEANR